MYKEIKTEPLGDCISAVAWSNNGNSVAVGTLDEKILIKDAQLNTLHTLKAEMGVVDLEFNLDGSKLLASCMDYSLRVINTETAEQEIIVDCEPLQSWKARFSGDGQFIYTAADLGKLYCFGTESGQLEHDERLGDHFLSSLAVSPMGDIVVGNTKGDLHFQGHQGESSFLLTEHRKSLRALTFSMDSSKIIMASDDLRISVYDLEQQTTITMFSGHKNFINDLSCHPQAPIFASWYIFY